MLHDLNGRVKALEVKVGVRDDDAPQPEPIEVEESLPADTEGPTESTDE